MNNWRLRREDLLKDDEWAEFKQYLETKANNNSWQAVQDRAICLTAVWTGLRRSELANLKISDIHFGDRPYLIVRNGKGGKYREVLISKECHDFLLNFCQSRCLPITSDYLFVPQRGNKYTGDGIYRVWKTAMKDAGLPPRSAHKARHFYATKIHEATKDLQFLKEQLGHSSLNTTSVYTHITEKQAEKYLSDFDKKL